MGFGFRVSGLAPLHTQGVFFFFFLGGGGGGAACHAKACIFNAVQQFSLVLASFPPPAVSFHRPPPKPLPFQGLGPSPSIPTSFKLSRRARGQGIRGARSLVIVRDLGTLA